MTLKLTALSGGELDTLTRRTFILGVEHTDLSGDVSVRPQVVDMTGVHIPPASPTSTQPPTLSEMKNELHPITRRSSRLACAAASADYWKLPWTNTRPAAHGNQSVISYGRWRSAAPGGSR